MNKDDDDTIQIEEEKKTSDSKIDKQPSKDTILGENEERPPLVEVNWSMFEKVCKIGEGANGIVYKVRALKTTIYSPEYDGRIELSNPELVKKYGS